MEITAKGRDLSIKFDGKETASVRSGLHTEGPVTLPGSKPAFMISGVDAAGAETSAPARFLFATEDGTIVGWNPNVNPAGFDPAKAGNYGIIAVDNSGNNFTVPPSSATAPSIRTRHRHGCKWPDTPVCHQFSERHGGNV